MEWYCLTFHNAHGDQEMITYRKPPNIADSALRPNQARKLTSIANTAKTIQVSMCISSIPIAAHCTHIIVQLRARKR